jgi:hypothetical protein
MHDAGPRETGVCLTQPWPVGKRLVICQGPMTSSVILMNKLYLALIGNGLGLQGAIKGVQKPIRKK